MQNRKWFSIEKVFGNWTGKLMLRIRSFSWFTASVSKFKKFEYDYSYSKPGHFRKRVVVFGTPEF